MVVDVTASAMVYLPYASANGVTMVPEAITIPSTAYLAEPIAVTFIMLPATPPLVEPFNVITSLLAPDIKVLPVASLLPKYSAPTNLSVPSVLISKSVAADSTIKVKVAPKLFH